MRDDSVYLDYIEESIELVERSLRHGSGALDRTRFEADALTRDAVLHRIETLAVATGHLSAELRARHPDIEWRKIVDFRNVLAHGYVRLDLDPVWRSIMQDLPALKTVIEQERS